MSQSHQEILEQDLSVLNGVPVLVVEDAWHVARAMKSALSQLGMNVIGPTDGHRYPPLRGYLGYRSAPGSRWAPRASEPLRWTAGPASQGMGRV